jgi:hypothetical protein
MPIRLTAVDGDQTIDLRAGASLVVGRAPDDDAPVIDSTVSRRHAELVRGERGRGARPGVEQRDLRQRRAVERATARVGDLVRFGKVGFRVRRRAGAARGAARDHNPVAAGRCAAPRTVVRPVFVAAVSDDAPAPPPRGADAGEQRLRILLDVSVQLTRAESVDALLEKVVDVCFRTFGGDRVALVLGSTADSLAAKIARDRHGRPLDVMVPLSIARTGGRRACRGAHRRRPRRRPLRRPVGGAPAGALGALRPAPGQHRPRPRRPLRGPPGPLAPLRRDRP